MVLKITNGHEIIELKDKYCLQLECEVNKFGKLDNWRSIGDHLYYFGCPNMSHPKSSDTLKVDEKYFVILKNIIQTKKFI